MVLLQNASYGCAAPKESFGAILVMIIDNLDRLEAQGCKGV